MKKNIFRESFRKNGRGIAFMIGSALCVCIGQFFWKISYNNSVLLLGFGFILYTIGALLMITAYRFGSLSVLQPILSINYIFTILIGYFALHELITTAKLIGIFIIMTGVFLICGGDE